MAASAQISLGYVNAGQLYHVNPPTVGLDARGVVPVPEPPTFANRELEGDLQTEGW